MTDDSTEENILIDLSIEELAKLYCVRLEAGNEEKDKVVNSMEKNDMIDESKIGLFWYTDKYEIIVSKVNDAGGPSEDHYTTWYRLKNSGLLKIPYSEAEWDFYKRGRVVYDPWEGKGVFSVYSGESCSNGKCSNDKFVRMVKKEYKLKDNVRWFYSSHYDRSKDMVSFNIDGSEIDDN